MSNEAPQLAPGKPLRIKPELHLSLAPPRATWLGREEREHLAAQKLGFSSGVPQNPGGLPGGVPQRGKGVMESTEGGIQHTAALAYRLPRASTSKRQVWEKDFQKSSGSPASHSCSNIAVLWGHGPGQGQRTRASSLSRPAGVPGNALVKPHI